MFFLPHRLKGSKIVIQLTSAEMLFRTSCVCLVRGWCWIAVCDKLVWSLNWVCALGWSVKASTGNAYSEPWLGCGWLTQPSSDSSPSSSVGIFNGYCQGCEICHFWSSEELSIGNLIGRTAELQSKIWDCCVVREKKLSQLWAESGEARFWGERVSVTNVPDVSRGMKKKCIFGYPQLFVL